MVTAPRVWFRVTFVLLCALSLWLGAIVVHLRQCCQRQPQVSIAQKAARPPLSTATETSDIATPLLCMTPTVLNRRGAVAVYITDPPRLVTDNGLGTRYERFCWSADHHTLLASQEDGPLVLLDYNALTQRFGLPYSLAHTYANPGVEYTLHTYNNPFAWSQDGRWVVIVEERTRLQLYDVRTGKHHLLLNMASSTDEIAAVAFAPDGKRLALSIAGHNIPDPHSLEAYNNLWLVNSDGGNLHKLGHGDSVSWSPDGKWLLTVADAGREVRRYDSRTGESYVLRQAALEVIEGAVYSPDGRYIAMAGPYIKQGTTADGLFLTDNEGKFLRVLAGHRDANLSGSVWFAW